MKLPHAVLNITPDLIVKFANGSRIHFGRKLHAIVLIQRPDIINGQLKICTSTLSDNLVFILSHKVKASMQKNTYNTQITLSADGLIVHH